MVFDGGFAGSGFVAGSQAEHCFYAARIRKAIVYVKEIDDP
jgi:hypothetical protein